MIEVRLQREDFSTADALARLEALGGGGVASFTGLVRGGGGLVELMLEHHPTMTLARMEAIAAEAAGRWPLLGLTMIHRHGGLAPGERIVLVATASAHRAAAIEACAFLIDWLKTAAPFWKRERFGDGRTSWVEAKPEDDTAARRWHVLGEA